MSKFKVFSETIASHKRHNRNLFNLIIDIEGKVMLHELGWNPERYLKEITEATENYAKASADYVAELNELADFLETEISIKKELATPLPTLIA